LGLEDYFQHVKTLYKFTPLILLALLTGCMSASKHGAEVNRAVEGDNLTVGSVQKKISVGMSGADVVSALGSPNIVTTDDMRRETWVYDKISTTVARSESSSGVFLLIVGSGSSSGAASRSQRTLTVIIKFDPSGKVRDFAYHTSRF
tara:strand:+ start:286 stop:726 length:441 start_codon:yes stop_codon:yes gene_type:complete